MAAPVREVRLVLSRREAYGIAAGAAVVGILLFLAGMGAGASAGCGSFPDDAATVATAEAR